MAKAKAPRGLAWRDGRPRWIASPALRKGGWKGRDLKDAAGNWLAWEAACDAAAAINADVERWRSGAAVERYAPDPEAGRQARDRALSGRMNERSIEAAFERFKQSRHYLRLAGKTRTDYRQKLGAFLVFAGETDPAAWSAAIFEEWMEKRADQLFAMRGLKWTLAQWKGASPAKKAEIRAERQTDLNEREDGNTPGHPQAAGELAAIRRLFSFCVRPLGWIQANPAADYSLDSVRVRIRVVSRDEEASLIAKADELGLPEVGDLIILMAETALRVNDAATLPVGKLAGGRLRLTPEKTRRSSGFRIDAPLTLRLAERLETAAKRRGYLTLAAMPNDAPAIADGAGNAIAADLLRRRFVTVRDAVGLGTVLLKDFRDTLVVRLAEAGCTPFEVASITGHSLATVNNILRHYFAPTAELADNAIGRLEAGRKGNTAG